MGISSSDCLLTLAPFLLLTRNACTAAPSRAGRAVGRDGTSHSVPAMCPPSNDVCTARGACAFAFVLLRISNDASNTRLAPHRRPAKAHTSYARWKDRIPCTGAANDKSTPRAEWRLARQERETALQAGEWGVGGAVVREGPR